MKRFLTAIAAVLCMTMMSAQDKTYYVSVSGDDSANGLTPSQAWRTLDKINSTIFQPGDKILLKAGEVWYGQLKMQGSGSKGKPITLSSWGEGRPVINIGRARGAAVLIADESWWTVENIEVTSGASPELGVGRQGIVITGGTEGKDFSHFVVRNCYVHDIWGQMGGNDEYSGYFSCGILVRVKSDSRRMRPRDKNYVPATMNDVLIEGNRIERMDKCGIISFGPKNNVVVRGNYIDNLGGDGIFVNGPYKGLIEYNEIHRTCMRSGNLDLPGGEKWWPHTAACWIQNTEGTIMQFNQVYDTGREPKNGDGEAYDFDFGCKNCILQYNYSKENSGFMLLMYEIQDNIVRYNISENDKTHLIQMQGSLEENTVFYNNIFYVDHGTLDLDYFVGNATDDLRKPEEVGAKFYNNIFYATGQGRFRSVYSSRLDEVTFNFDETSKPSFPSGTMFRNNCYFGPWKNGLPDDPDALIADPCFVAPGTGGTGLETLFGYKLRSGSPCIDAGTDIPDNGGRDFFGAMLQDGKTDIGAYEAGDDVASTLYDVRIEDIRCSDPFIFADKADHTYYMYSTGGFGRVMARASKDLKMWTKPFCVMRFPETHWAGSQAASWATEVHLYNGKYYLFTTSHSKEIITTIPGRGDVPHRATQIYVADSPRGPFVDFTDNKPHTPWNWASLDGTLWVENGTPYMIFCHEWLQITDGTMELLKLPKNLGIPKGKPVTLFKASDAPWSGEMLELGEKTNGVDIGGNVTDGPWLFRTQTGRLGMLWSSWSRNRYAIGVAWSQSGKVKGPWIQEEKPLFDKNGGHGMMFRDFDGNLRLCMHITDPKDINPGRRPVVWYVDDSGDSLVLTVPEDPDKPIKPVK